MSKIKEIKVGNGMTRLKRSFFGVSIKGVILICSAVFPIMLLLAFANVMVVNHPTAFAILAVASLSWVSLLVYANFFWKGGNK